MYVERSHDTSTGRLKRNVPFQVWVLGSHLLSSREGVPSSACVESFQHELILEDIYYTISQHTRVLWFYWYFYLENERMHASNYHRAAEMENMFTTHCIGAIKEDAMNDLTHNTIYCIGSTKHVRLSALLRQGKHQSQSTQHARESQFKKTERLSKHV